MNDTQPTQSERMDRMKAIQKAAFEEVIQSYTKDFHRGQALLFEEYCGRPSTRGIGSSKKVAEPSRQHPSKQGRS